MEVLEIVAPLRNGHVNGYAGNAGLNEVVAPVAESPVEFPAFQSSPPQPVSTIMASPAETTPRTDVPKQPQAAKGPADPGNTARQKASHRTRRGHAKGTAKSAEKSEPPGGGIKYVPQRQLDAELARLEKLSQAALAGDTAALDRLRAELDRCPHIWQRYGDLQYLMESKLIGLVASGDPLRGEALRKRSSILRHHLLEGEPASLAVKMAAA